MTVYDRAHYLVIHTGLAVINTYYNHINRSVGNSPSPRCNCKGWQIVQPTTSRDMLTWIEKQTANNSAETRRTKFNKNV